MPKNSQSGQVRPGLPPRQGLYDPRFEHDACGVGMVVNIDGKKSHEIIRQGLTVLTNLTHRGARGAETNVGDGAGILMQVPHAFLQRKAERHGFTLPEPGQYGVGMVFLPPDVNHRRAIEIHFEKIISSEGQRVLGWRTVKVNNEALGNTAKRAWCSLLAVRTSWMIWRSSANCMSSANARKMKFVTGVALKAVNSFILQVCPTKH
jgi:glutamate synthase domain-containing protein 1